MNPDQKKEILTMLYGPYKKSWYVKGVVDNTDATIAKRMGLKPNLVAMFTSLEGELRTQYINELINDNTPTHEKEILMKYYYKKLEK